MVRYHPQNSFGCKQTEVLVTLVLVQNFEHPYNDRRLQNFFLVSGVMFDVEVDYIEQLVDDSRVLANQQSLEHEAKELFVQGIQSNVSRVTVISIQVHANLRLLVL